MPEQSNPWFVLVRSARSAAARLIEAGAEPGHARAILVEMGAAALPDREPLRAWAGALLARAIDDAIFRAFRQLHEGT